MHAVGSVTEQVNPFSVRRLTQEDVKLLKLEYTLRAQMATSQNAKGVGTRMFGITDVQEHISAKGEVAYLVEWNGQEIPVGLEIEGATVAWIEQNTVRFIHHGCTGTYERLVRNGGVSRDEQKILVYFSPYVVKEITTDEAFNRLKLEQSFCASSLKDTHTGSHTVSFESHKLPHHEHVYCVEWCGEAVPRGVVLGKNRITNAHQNLLVFDGPARMGRYERVYRDHGDNKNEHKILVYL